MKKTLKIFPILLAVLLLAKAKFVVGSLKTTF